MKNTFFTADEHYGHKNMIKFCNRPVDEGDLYGMMELLIKKHNNKVPVGGITYHLGDMFWRTVRPTVAYDILERLNGQHYYVYGNHDELIREHDWLRQRFIWCREIATLEPRKEFSIPKIALCHYAMRTWHLSYRGSWQLYGHSHGALPEAGLSFDVGVDANNLEPVSLAEVAARMSVKLANGVHNADFVPHDNEWDKGADHGTAPRV